MSSKILKPCERCGKGMLLKPSKSGQKFCSLTCRSYGHFELKTCPVCGREFRLELNRKLADRGMFCSRSCRHSRTMSERFWDKVDKAGPVPSHVHGLGNCWIWTGAKDPLGYGFFRESNSKPMSRSHRVSWALSVGDIGNMLVLHKCDNPSCVRPDHLFLGTNQDNIDDRDRKGRQRCAVGKRASRVYLTPQQLHEIRSSALPKAELSRMFGVHKTTIRRIIAGRPAASTSR